MQADGNCGRDNSFGADLLPILQSADNIPNPSEGATSAIQAGTAALEIEIDGLDTSVSAPTNIGLSVQTFATAHFDAVNNEWPVRSDLYADAKTGHRLDVAYITKGVLVARGGTITFPLVLPSRGPGMDIHIDLVIHDAILMMTLEGGHAMLGTIAGVLDTTELVHGLQLNAGRISASLCGNAFDRIAEQIRECSDILVDGTNRANVPCNGVSIGLGFTGGLTANPTRTAPPTSLPDPCVTQADAGADAPMDSSND